MTNLLFWKVEELINAHEVPFCFVAEATIMKLKLAPQRDIRSIEEEPMTIEIDDACASASETSQNELSLLSVEANEMETRKQTNCSSIRVTKRCSHSLSSSTSEEVMTIDTSDASLACGDCHPMINLVKQQRNKSLSIAAMFSKYKSGQRAQGSACEETMSE